MFGVFSVRGEDSVLAIRNVQGWLEDDEPRQDAIFPTVEEAREWADANYPVYFMDPRECANDWKAYRFEVRAI